MFYHDRQEHIQEDNFVLLDAMTKTSKLILIPLTVPEQQITVSLVNVAEINSLQTMDNTNSALTEERQNAFIFCNAKEVHG